MSPKRLSRREVREWFAAEDRRLERIGIPAPDWTKHDRRERARHRITDTERDLVGWRDRWQNQYNDLQALWLDKATQVADLSAHNKDLAHRLGQPYQWSERVNTVSEPSPQESWSRTERRNAANPFEYDLEAEIETLWRECATLLNDAALREQDLVELNAHHDMLRERLDVYERDLDGYYERQLDGPAAEPLDPVEADAQAVIDTIDRLIADADSGIEPAPAPTRLFMRALGINPAAPRPALQEHLYFPEVDPQRIPEVTAAPQGCAATVDVEVVLPRSALDDAQSRLYDSLVDSVDPQRGCPTGDDPRSWGDGYREGVEHALETIRLGTPIAEEFVLLTGHVSYAFAVEQSDRIAALNDEAREQALDRAELAQALDTVTAERDRLAADLDWLETGRDQLEHAHDTAWGTPGLPGWAGLPGTAGPVAPQLGGLDR
jgi:hypothetical protein